MYKAVCVCVFFFKLSSYNKSLFFFIGVSKSIANLCEFYWTLLKRESNGIVGKYSVVGFPTFYHIDFVGFLLIYKYTNKING